MILSGQVRVRNLHPQGHNRVPHYLRGKSGQIERVIGEFPNPEKRAYRHVGENRTLYRVRFLLSELWNEADPNDVLEAEIYDHWLEPINAA